MQQTNNASNSRTDQFARNRFRSVTKDVRLQLKPANRALDFSSLRFQSVYRKSSSNQTESAAKDSVPQTEPIQTEPTQTDPTQTKSTQNEPIQTKQNGLANLCLSLRSDNPFFSGIEAMPDIRPRKKSIPLVSELVLKVCNT